jgi:putative addiction module killer protein
MVTILETETYTTWFEGLRDKQAKAKIAARIDRLALGNAGDVAPVGEGVSELRLHYGPGYRVYYCSREHVIVILLCGGDKSRQERDIAAAKSLARSLKE